MTIDESTEGKRVLDADGAEVGVVSGIRDGQAYVDPAPGVTGHTSSKIEWDAGDGEYPIPPESIERITDDEVHLDKDY